MGSAISNQSFFSLSFSISLSLCLTLTYLNSFTLLFRIGLINANTGVRTRPFQFGGSLDRIVGNFIQNKSVEDNKTSTQSHHELTSLPNLDFTQEVWCYCNLAQCVPKGYMCKSGVGACFTKSVVESTNAQRLHKPTVYDSRTNTMSRGCVELLSWNERRMCKMKLNANYISSSSDESVGNLQQNSLIPHLQSNNFKNKPISGADSNHEDPHVSKDSSNDLQCCNQDVCNYEVLQPIIIVKNNKEEKESFSTNISWFKAATISVTVAGVIVLILLIILAGRLLSFDGKGNNEYYNEGEQSYVKASMCIQRTSSSSERGSILCVKSLQKNDVGSFCGLHPLASNNNRNSLSCPTSPSLCSTIHTSPIYPSLRSYGYSLVHREEIEPLTQPPSSASGLLIDHSLSI